MATKKAATAKADQPALTCRYGEGAYGSPKSMKRCGNERRATRQLCDEHEALWRVEAKKRREARTAAEPKAATTKRARASKRAAEADDVPASRVGSRRPPAPPKQPIARVPFVEPQPAVAQLVTPQK